MKEVKLVGTDKVTLVDDDDYEAVMRHTWCLRGPYALCQESFWDKRTNVLLHRYIMRAFPKEIVDHINFNKLDNRKENLRIVDSSMNNFHRLPNKRNSSGYKNINWYKEGKKWRVAIKKDYKLYHVGYFPNLEDAIAARNAKAIELYGEAVVDHINELRGTHE